MCCDLKTRILCQNTFSFKYMKHAEFKGKSISIPIFRPTNPQEEFVQCSKQIMPPQVFLKTHMNRLDMSSEEIDQSSAEAFGVGEIM